MNVRFRVVLLAAAGLMAVSMVGLGIASPALAQSSSPVTVPVQVGVSTTSAVYYAPNANAATSDQIFAGQTWFVLGTDSTGMWVEVFITPSSEAWVPATALALNGMTLPVIAGVTGGPAVANPAPASSANSAPASAAPTQHFTIALGSSALVGVNSTTTAYDRPSTSGDNAGQLVAGQTWFVLGQDSTGKFTYVQITPNDFVWVPSSSLNLASLTLPVIPGF